MKITDFGVSRAVNQAPMTATGMVMGTAQYLSPEQAVGRPATPASDLYSLGIVAYESLAGHRPFTGPTAVAIAVAHVNDPVPALPASVDPRLAALVLRLLAKEPADRPRSAAALARLFDEMVGQTPPEGTPLLDHTPGAPVGAAPPSYPPRRPGADPVDVRAAVAGRTSTTTGRRLGRLTWPFLALLLLLIALLGAKLADSIMGQSTGNPTPAAASSDAPGSSESLERAPFGAMITSRAPTDSLAGAFTTTAKDT